WKGAIDTGAGLSGKAASLGVYALSSEPGTSFSEIWDESGGLSLNIADAGAIYDMFSGGLYQEGKIDENSLKLRSKIRNGLTGTGINLNITSSGVSTSFGSGSDIGLMNNLYNLENGLSTRSWAKEKAASLGENGDAFKTQPGIRVYETFW
ncbi:MAG: hypothetical protein PQJ46_10485, partial [Spirochaetales bacterium]|nr:hypothetical protein [Spirochaetales bacterium]